MWSINLRLVGCPSDNSCHDGDDCEGDGNAVHFGSLLGLVDKETISNQYMDVHPSTIGGMDLFSSIPHVDSVLGFSTKLDIPEMGVDCIAIGLYDLDCI